MLIGKNKNDSLTYHQFGGYNEKFNNINTINSNDGRYIPVLTYQFVPYDQTQYKNNMNNNKNNNINDKQGGYAPYYY